MQESVEAVFADLDALNLESLLAFWLSIGVSSTSSEPLLELADSTVERLVRALHDYPCVSVKLWYMSLKALAGLLAVRTPRQRAALTPSLLQLVYKLLSTGGGGGDSASASAYSHSHSHSHSAFGAGSHATLSSSSSGGVFSSSSSLSLIGDECCLALSELLARLGGPTTGDSPASCVELRCQLLDVLCTGVHERHGCMTPMRAHGSIDAQVTFVQWLINTETTTTSSTPTPTAPNTTTTTASSSNSQFAESSAKLDAMLATYFDRLSMLVLRHLSMYPRINLKGEVSPRSCFSGVLGSLLYPQQLHHHHHHHHHHHNHQQQHCKHNAAAAAVAKQNFKGGSSSSFDAFAFNLKNSHHTLQEKLAAHHHKLFGGGGGLGSAAAAAAAAGGAGGGAAAAATMTPAGAIASLQRHSPVTSVQCNRDMLVSLLLKYAICLVSNSAQSQQQQQATTSKSASTTGGTSSSGSNELFDANLDAAIIEDFGEDIDEEKLGATSNENNNKNNSDGDEDDDENDNDNDNDEHDEDDDDHDDHDDDEEEDDNDDEDEDEEDLLVQQLIMLEIEQQELKHQQQQQHKQQQLDDDKFAQQQDDLYSQLYANKSYLGMCFDFFFFFFIYLYTVNTGVLIIAPPFYP